MRRPQGYAQIVSPDGATVNFDRIRIERIPSGVYEADTFSCCHCNRVVHVPVKAPMDNVGSMCRNCMKMVCPTCAEGPCVPFEKKLEAVEKKQYIKDQYAKL